MANLKRLFHTYRELGKVSNARFDMRYWSRRSKVISCGTTCCAFGTEAVSEYGKRNGLGLDFNTNYPRHLANIVLDGKQYDDGFLAASKYYDISHVESEFLFSPDLYHNAYLTDPKYVQKRIGDFICDKLKEKEWPT